MWLSPIAQRRSAASSLALNWVGFGAVLGLGAASLRVLWQIFVTHRRRLDDPKYCRLLVQTINEQKQARIDNLIAEVDSRSQSTEQIQMFAMEKIRFAEQYHMMGDSVKAVEAFAQSIFVMDPLNGKMIMDNISEQVGKAFIEEVSELVKQMRASTKKGGKDLKDLLDIGVD